MGVDPKRPLIAFALVAVLCAVLMSLSVGEGWGTNVFSPGRPIAPTSSSAPPSSSAPRDRVPPPAALAEVRIPAELSTQPLGAATAAAVPPLARTSRAVRSSRAVHRAAPTADRKPGKAVGKSERKAVGKSERKADKAAHTSERKAAKAAHKAARKAARDAKKATRDAEKVSSQA